MTDGRFSGASHGFVIGHIVPEATDRGPIAAVKNGDTINIDVKKRRLDVEVSGVEIKKRLAAVKLPKPRYTTGVFAKYARLRPDRLRGRRHQLTHPVYRPDPRAWGSAVGFDLGALTPMSRADGDVQPALSRDQRVIAVPEEDGGGR